VAAPDGDDFVRAGNLSDAIPEVLQRAARHQSDVVPMLLGLLHAPPGAVRDAQQYELRARVDAGTTDQALDYAERIADLHPMLRLPLASLAFPVLRRRPRPELRQFMDTVFALVHADGKVDLFEYCLGRMLQAQVSEALDPSRAWVPGNRRLADATREATQLLAIVAQAGHENPADAPRAFVAGLDRVFPRLNASLSRAVRHAGHARRDPAGARPARADGQGAAAGGPGGRDRARRQVSVAESELLRAVCASLHVPLPPLDGIRAA
jgi:hypothetical protein